MSDQSESDEAPVSQEATSLQHSVLKWVVVFMVVAAMFTGWFWQHEQKRTFGVDIVGHNHTDDAIDFYVDGHMGGNIPPHGGGGRSACCVAIPAHYKPGLTVKIVWEATHAGPGTGNYQTREVPVPPYDANQVAQFSVHFLRGGEIKVLAATTDAMYPSYPIKDPY